MTVSQDPQHPGTIGALADMGAKMASSLGPTFLCLVLLNIGFLGIVLWWIDAQAESRIRLLEKIIDHCLK